LEVKKEQNRTEQNRRAVKLAVDKLWNQKLISDCSQKSSLAFCETAILSIGNIHRIWTAVQNNIKDVRRGGIKDILLYMYIYTPMQS
jgi:hypothetical protein